MALITDVERKKPLYQIGYIILLIILTAGIAVQFFPMVWMIIGGFKTDLELISPVFKFLPGEWLTENYVKAFTQYNFLRNVYNTCYLLVAILIIQVTNSALSAYSLSKIKPKGGNVIFLYFLATMMFSGTALMFPLYIMMVKVGLIGSKWALILSSSAWAYCIFLFKNFFDGVPIELFEAADIDGCGKVKSFTHILLPLSKPVCVVCLVQSFIAVYNDFLYPFMMLPNEQDWTIMIRLYMIDKSGSADMPILYVLMTVATIPSLILFLLAQKNIAQGISMTGIKG